MVQILIYILCWYQCHTTPPEVIFFSCPHPSVKLLYFDNSPELTQKFLDFAKTRPYAESIPSWWETANVEITTELVAQKIQELEHDNRNLPELSEGDRFKITSEQMYKHISEWQEYKRKLCSIYPFMLDNERELIIEVVKMMDKACSSYYQLAYSRDTYSDQIVKRKYLQEVKNIIGEELYNKGILPSLMPVFKNFP